MNEGFAQSNEKLEDERLLSDAEYVINSMWKTVMDPDDLPLDAHSSYQAWSEDLEQRKSDFARVLFKKARESSGEEKLRFAKTLNRLTKLIDAKAILKELMTTQETVKELVRQAEEQVSSKQTKLGRIESNVRKTIDRILMRDDD